MSLGDCTKCDLSAGVAKLDMTTLTKQTEKYFYSLIKRINKKTSSVLYDTLTEESRKKTVSSMSCTGSNELVQMANDIAEVAELLYTLYESPDREIEIVKE